jgi:5-methylcytosine-specific restriction endonuclease McrA
MERTRRSDEKTNAVARAKYAENPEENRAKRAAWREAHREECREYNRKWTEANREQVRLAQHVYLERYPERARQTRKTWRENNPEWFRANGQMRRCRDSESHFTGPDILEQIARQRKRCFYCGEKLGPGYHVDHITPVSKGGSNGLENIAIACAPCNRRKLAKWPWEFARYDGQAVML